MHGQKGRIYMHVFDRVDAHATCFPRAQFVFDQNSLVGI